MFIVTTSELLKPTGIVMKISTDQYELIISKRQSRPVKVTSKHDHVPQSADGDLTGNWAKYWAQPSCSSCHKQAKHEL